MAFALREGRGRDARYAVLNSTPAGKTLYLLVWFRSLGWGQTWFLRAPPAPQEQSFEGHRASIWAAHATAGRSSAVRRDAFLARAVQFSRNRVARWLTAHGALVDVVYAQGLGWRSEVTSLLQDHPERASFRSGSGQKTPLRVAAEHKDLSIWLPLSWLPGQT